MKVIFLGTPEFSVQVLNAILASSHEVVGVITNPDQTGKRGKKLIISPVKEFAYKNNLPLSDAFHPSLFGQNGLSELIDPVDHLHPSAFGSELLCDTLGKSLKDNQLTN